MCDDDNMCGLFLFSHSSRIAHNLKNPKHTSVSFCSENNKKRKKNVVKKNVAHILLLQRMHCTY